MNDLDAVPHGCLKIKEIDNDYLEVNYWQYQEKANLSWTMHKEEVRDLMEWWMAEGRERTDSDAVLINSRYKSIFITMHTPSLLMIGHLDKQGRKLMNGFLVDREVIELLAGAYSGKYFLCDLSNERFK